MRQARMGPAFPAVPLRVALTTLVTRQGTGARFQRDDCREEGEFGQLSKGIPQKACTAKVFRVKHGPKIGEMDGTLTAEERELFDDLRSALRTEFQKAGHGSQKRTLKAIGLKKAALDSAFSRGSVKVLVLLRILKHLGVESGEFFTNAFPEGAQTFAGASAPGSPPPAGVQNFQKRRARGDFDDV